MKSMMDAIVGYMTGQVAINVLDYILSRFPEDYPDINSHVNKMLMKANRRKYKMVTIKKSCRRMEVNL